MGPPLYLMANGRVLVWDATCPDTLAALHTTLEAGAVANQADNQKKKKSSNLAACFILFRANCHRDIWCILAQGFALLPRVGKMVRAETGGTSLIPFPDAMDHSWHPAWDCSCNAGNIIQ